MTDYYTQRLEEKRQAKEAMYKPNLPLQRPNNKQDQLNGVGRGVITMAGTPAQPQPEQPPLPNSLFKKSFDQYTQDPAFKGGMEEFATIIQSMRKELDGLGLPPEVMQKRVEALVDQYSKGAQNFSMKQQQQSQHQLPQQGAMEGVM